MTPKRPIRKMYDGGGPLRFNPNLAPNLNRADLQDPLATNQGVNISPVANAQSRYIVNPDNAQGGNAVGQTIANGVNKLTPYLSNFVNSMRTPPAPVRGRMLQNVGLQKVDLSNERADIDRGTRTANLMARQSTDGASAAAVAGANAARNFEAKGNSYAREAQMNSGIANQQAQMNAGIDAQNISRDDNYNNQVLEMKMAQQRAQSQNLSNASDKMIMERNASAARDLDTQKFKILSKAYGNGVVDRLANSVLGRGSGEAMTQEDYDRAMGIGKNAFGGKLKKVYAAGGPLADGPGDPDKGGVPPVVPGPAVYKTQAEVDAANQFSKNFMARRPLLSTAVPAQDTYVATKPGDPVVPFIGDKGTLASQPLPTTVPYWVGKDDLQNEDGKYFYEDRDGGMRKYVDPSVVNTPRFRKTPAQVATDLVAKHALGGALNSRLAFGNQTPRLSGKLTRVKI